MASTYSTNLKIELQATGENSGTWGTITNTNLGTALEQAIVGYGNPSYASDANLTLTYTDTNAAQAARALVLNVTSAVSLTATRELVVPTIQKQYIVQNNTTGSQSITVKTSAGTGITVPNGRKAHLYVDGTNVIYMDDYVDINGGAIDGTPIGASSASTGSFTTLTTSSTVTLNGGTANGVLYLDGSKVATSGSALTFDGTSTVTLGGSGVNATLKHGATNGRLVLSGDSAVVAAITITGSTYATANAINYDGTTHTWSNTTGTGYMLLNSTGLGIGTTSPANRLDVFASADWQGRVVGNAGFNGGFIVEGNATGSRSQINLKTNNGTPREYYLRNVSGTFSLLDNTAGTIPFTVEAATPSNTIYANASGNLGIGTTSPAAPLQVKVGANKEIQIYAPASSAIADVSTLGPGIKFTRPSDGAYNFSIFSYVSSGGLRNLAITTRNDLVFATGNDAENATEKMRLDSSGNLGLGVTPSAWASDKRALQFANGSSIYANTSVSAVYVGANFYENSSGSPIYSTSTFASQYYQYNGQHVWRNAPSGTAGNTISFTQAMTLDASGRLGIGTTSPASGTRLHMVDSAGCILRLVRTSNRFDLIADTDFLDINARDSGTYLRFLTADTERARITAGGNLLVGTTTDVSGLSGVISDVSGNVRAIPQSGSDKTGSYTLVKSDVGKFIGVGSGGSITVPDATFATGDVVSIFNNTTGNVTLTMTITTAYIGGTNTDKATITLATRGVATILFISGTVCVVNGNVS